MKTHKTQMPPLAVYVHWPFCRSKCPYCDFNSHVRARIDETAWAEALCRELDYFATFAGPRRVTSIFFGGGTPSLMSPTTVGRILERVGNHWQLEETVEITLEANPTSVEADKFRDFAAAGINRVSLGVQSLRDVDLKALGREHDVAEARTAIDLAQKYFRRHSFDLIYARMGQSLSDWEQELQEALELAVDHLSLYQLTIEQGTAFYNAYHRGRLRLLEEEVAADMYDITQDICAAAGLPAYEISNHARPGEESRHNLAYWRYEEYLGIGPGAHGRLSMGEKVYALSQKRKPEDWLRQVEADGHATEFLEPLSALMMAEEMVMMGLRLREGVSLKAVEKRIGRSISDFLDQTRLENLVDQGLLDWRDGTLRTTRRGRPLLNALLRQILA